MRVKFTERWSARQGQTAEVTDAAGERLISQGLAEKTTTHKVAADSGDGGETKPKSRKTTKKTSE